MKVEAEIEIFKPGRREAKTLVWRCLRNIERLKLGKVVKVDC